MQTDPSDPSVIAATARSTALENDALGHCWRGKPLQPWTKRREMLYLALQSRAQKSGDFVEAISNSLDSLDFVLSETNASLVKNKEELEAGGTVPTVEDLINWHRFLASASRVLWLAHHDSVRWDNCRAEPDVWLRDIEVWSDEFIDAHEIITAVKLAHLLRTEHKQFVTMPRPEKKTPGVDVGN